MRCFPSPLLCIQMCPRWQNPKPFPVELWMHNRVAFPVLTRHYTPCLLALQSQRKWVLCLSGRSRNFEKWGGGRSISVVVIYRKCTREKAAQRGGAAAPTFPFWIRYYCARGGKRGLTIVAQAPFVEFSLLQSRRLKIVTLQDATLKLGWRTGAIITELEVCYSSLPYICEVHSALACKMGFMIRHRQKFSIAYCILLDLICVRTWDACKGRWCVWKICCITQTYVWIQ